MPPYLPNLLSTLRIALAPAMLGAAMDNAKAGFAVLLGVALLTDEFDGVLARRAGAASKLGRQLDRWGDGLTMVMGAVGFELLWPAAIEGEIWWALTALIGYAAIGLERMLRTPNPLAHPTWLARMCAALVPLATVPLIAGWTPWVFRAAAVLHALVGLTRLAAPRDDFLTTPRRRRLVNLQRRRKRVAPSSK